LYHLKKKKMKKIQERFVITFHEEGSYPESWKRP
jgi:hypothetical protein